MLDFGSQAGTQLHYFLVCHFFQMSDVMLRVELFFVRFL